MSSSNNMTSNVAEPRQIVGAVYVEKPRPWWVPVGLELTQGPGANVPVYAPVSFGATREWKNDNEGWQTSRSRRQRRRQDNKH